MRSILPPLLLISAALTVPAHAQLTPGGPSGDFRVNDRSGTAPTAGPPGGPSLSPGSLMFRDALGSKPPEEILKNIDKELGRSEPEQSSTSSPSFNLERDLRSPSDKFK